MKLQVKTVQRKDSGRPKKKVPRVETRRACKRSKPEDSGIPKSINDENKVVVMESSVGGHVLAIIRLENPSREGDQIFTDLTCTFFEKDSKKSGEIRETYSFPAERILKCVPEGIEDDFSAYSALIRQAFAHRDKAREVVEKAILWELTAFNLREAWEKRQKLLRVLIRKNRTFRAQCQKWIYFAVVSAIMTDAGKYR